MHLTEPLTWIKRDTPWLTAMWNRSGDPKNWRAELITGCPEKVPLTEPLNFYDCLAKLTSKSRFFGAACGVWESQASMGRGSRGWWESSEGKGWRMLEWRAEPFDLCQPRKVQKNQKQWREQHRRLQTRPARNSLRERAGEKHDETRAHFRNSVGCLEISLRPNAEAISIEPPPWTDRI